MSTDEGRTPSPKCEERLTILTDSAEWRLLCNEPAGHPAWHVDRFGAMTWQTTTPARTPS